MPSNCVHEAFAPHNILEAMLTMRGREAADKKKAAMEYLDSFQKSKAAWSTVISILQSPAEADALLFAATTLKGKITYDLAVQVSDADLPALREQILVLLKHYAAGPKPVRVQLCVCLAILAIQMSSWKDVLSLVVAALGNDGQSHACILDFLRVLPEEVTEGRKITLSEEELEQRTTELLADNAKQVVQLLISYAQSSEAAATNPQLFECITSWLREVPVSDIVESPLLNVIVHGMTKDDSLLAAAECLCTICRETREVDEYVCTIQKLLPRIIELRPRIHEAAREEDTEAFKAFTRVFADAGDAWVVAIAREPQTFRPLVDAILECAALDKDRDVIEYTFSFWYELKQLLTLERYMQTRLQLVDDYAKLVDILLKLLEYPEGDGNDSSVDLFDGDRDQEEKFRDFRHQMGDTLKDACEIMGVSECLSKVLVAIQRWMQTHGSQATATAVPQWQSLEAPLFAMRAMARMVDKNEPSILPQIMPLLVQIPSHAKLRFAALMVIGRYTEWTSAHPEFLQPQFQYVVASFRTQEHEVIRAAAQSFKYICLDCKELLADQVVQLQSFYDQILDKLEEASQFEMTEGVANVVSTQKTGDIYRVLKVFVDPLVQRLMVKANNATDDKAKLAVADHLNLLGSYIQFVIPSVQAGQENPAVKYWQEIFPILATVLESFIDFTPICERIARCWRYMVISYRTDMTPLLPDMANKLAQAFSTSRQGCFLWVTSAILREFSEDRDQVSETLSDSIYVFFEQQTTSVLRIMSNLPPADLPDVIEDFFRLLMDALCYYYHKFIPSALFSPVLKAAISALALEQKEPLSATLHYLRDLLSYGAPDSILAGPEADATAQHLRKLVRDLVASQGEALIKQTLAGMMITFPRDCFADGSGVLLEMFRLFPAQTTEWIDRTIRMLPDGAVTQVEANHLMAKIREKLASSDAANLRQVRFLLQDFTNTYRRRNIAPRDGLGNLELTRFHFEG